MTRQLGTGQHGALLAVIAGLAILSIVAGGAVAAPAEPPRPAPSLAEIQKAIRQLGDSDYNIRQRASEWLWQAGKAAEPALEKAAETSDDLETIMRARQILSRFHCGIYPDTPPKTVELINQFRFGGLGARQQVCQQLAAQKDRELLQRLIEHEPNQAWRDQLRQQFLRPPEPPSRSYAPRRQRKVRFPPAARPPSPPR